MPEPATPAAMQPVDADVHLHVATHRRELARPALPVVAAGDRVLLERVSRGQSRGGSGDG